jgi:hypothetical protein
MSEFRDESLVDLVENDPEVDRTQLLYKGGTVVFYDAREF